jgi:hypothetical protein
MMSLIEYVYNELLSKLLNKILKNDDKKLQDFILQ